MRTLAESLFDKDIVTKNLTFGDLYEPVSISSYGISRAAEVYTDIANMFIESKLKKNITSVDITKLPGVEIFVSKRGKEAMNCILGVIMNLPAKEFTDWGTNDYKKELDRVFEPLVKKPYWRRTLDIDIDNISSRAVQIHIKRSSKYDNVQVIISCAKK